MRCRKSFRNWKLFVVLIFPRPAFHRGELASFRTIRKYQAISRSKVKDCNLDGVGHHVQSQVMRLRARQRRTLSLSFSVSKLLNSVNHGNSF